MRTPVLIGLAVAVVAGPLLFVSGEFGGADGQAMEAAQAMSPGFVPWAEPLWSPPGPEVESLLFALQAALGAGVLGYCLGLWRGRAGRRDGDGKR